MNVRMIFTVLAVVVAALCIAPGVDAEECCEREVHTRFRPGHVEVQGGSQQLKASYLAAAFHSVFRKGDIRDCPLAVELVGDFQSQFIGIDEETGREVKKIMRTTPDYRFVGKITVKQPHDLVTLQVELVDLHRGTVIQAERASWSHPDQDFVRDKTKYEPELKMHELAKRFMPLDGKLHKYEGMPQTAQVEPEQYVIGSGQKMPITLSGILDSYKKPSKPWQWVMVEVDKGTLTNAISKWNDYYIYKVGDGTVKMQYKAPDECKEYQAEIIRVYNTCDIEPGTTPNDVGDKIAEKAFTVRCVRGSFEFTWEGTTEGEAGGTTAIIKYTESGEVPFDVEWKDGEGTFEAEEDIHGKSTLTATSASRVFKHSEKTTAKHVLKGEVLDPESDEPQLKVYWERHIYGEKITQEEEMILPLRDGAEKEFPVHKSEKDWTHDSTYTVKLHLDEEK